MIDMVDVINYQKNRLRYNLVSLDFAKGYCYGVLYALADGKQINDDEYNDFAKQIDDFETIIDNNQ